MHNLQVMAQPQGWDPNDPKYRCCCKTCHVKRGAMIIAIIEAVLLVLNLINVFYTMGQSNTTGGQIGGTIISILISAICIGLLIYGLKSEKAGFLIPHLVLQILGIIILFIAIIIIIVVLAIGATQFFVDLMGNGMDEKQKEALEDAIVVVGIIMIVTLLLTACLEIWFFTIVLSAYRFLKDKQIQLVLAVNMNQQSGITYPSTFTNPNMPSAPPAYSAPEGYPADTPFQYQGSDQKV